MIKKINIALAVVFAVLFGLKLLLDFAESAKADKRRVATAPVISSEASELAPRIYFTRWPPIFAPNVITKRNGFCLDLIREIFPNAVFDGTKVISDIEVMKEILRTDPNAVVAEYGDMKELEEFPTASEPMAWMPLCVYTSRSSEWSYTGVESLDQLRLGWASDNNDSPVLRAFAEKWRDVPGKAVIRQYSGDLSTQFWEAIKKGEMDGFVETIGYSEVSGKYNNAKDFVRYRQSKVIDLVEIKFRCSNVNPELSRQFCQAYDDGVHRLYRSGFIHRLLEYYMKDISAKGLKGVVFPIERYGEDQ